MILSTTGIQSANKMHKETDISLPRTISPLKLLAMQQEMQSTTTKLSGKQPESVPEMEADRAVQMVKRKLSSRLSAEADVRRLILEATDEGNLSRMYCGMPIPIHETNVQGGQRLHEEAGNFISGS